MRVVAKTFLLFSIAALSMQMSFAQLQITDVSSPLALAQRMVGDGVTISNVTFTGNSLMAGYFKNLSGSNPEIDSGIVLTSGRAKTTLVDFGMDGDGITISSNVLASTDWILPGDPDLASAIGALTSDMNDACVLEFDFVPLGDSIKFRYSFSSEEYEPAFACSNFIDAFGFFISGPGIVGLQNMALVPGTSLPVSILNINDVTGAFPPCPQNTAYYLDNSSGPYFTHEGLTQVLTALGKVQPCQQYHLKLVVSDNFDGLWDSGVFLEAKSLTSNFFQLTNLTQVDNSGNSYLVEGCATGSLKIRRQASTLFSQVVNLGYSGTVTNGVDVQMLPATITIPANETEVLLNIFPIVDNMPEGIEVLKIYTLAACGAATPTDSTVIQIRDYDTLGISPDTALICVGGSIQLAASAGYTTYQWNPNPGLSSLSIINPIATLASDSTLFICTSEEGTCHAKDSAFVFWRRLNLVSTRNINCAAGTTGQIVVDAGAEWAAPVEYSINNLPFQPSGIFNNLQVGTYTLRVRNGTSCFDSVVVTLVQVFPDLLVSNTAFTNATCSGAADGTVTITATGGNAPYQYSTDGITFQPSNIFNVHPGTFLVIVKDVNGCIKPAPPVIVQLTNSVTLNTTPVAVICEGKSTSLNATTNGTSVSWIPVASLTNALTISPVASPVVTTMYYITATTGICDRRDSLLLPVNPAPHANAGVDSTICFGASIQLAGSGGVVFSWQPSTYLSNSSAIDPIVMQPVTITYNLTVTDINGCVSLSTDPVIITVSPPAKLDAGRDTSIAIKQPLQLSATDVNNTGFINYTWSPTTGLNNPFIKNPIAILSDEVTFLIVTASTASHCVGIDTIRVKTFKGPEIYVANAFTPNGDGLHEYLKAFPVGIRSFSYFRIYNRYGQMVFATTNQNKGWDGRIKGVVQNMSSFVWIAEAIDYTGKILQRKGTTMIIQ
ncbi:MAG: choice-of-anchor L domain-containing protein [Ferruginibacter sp.]